MPRLRPLLIATVSSCFLASFALAVAAPSVAAHGPAHTTGHKAARPAPVSDVATYVAGNTITVDWKNPGSAFDRVVVRYRKGSIAPTISSGHGVHPGTAHARSATLQGLAADTTYSVAVWTRTGSKTSEKRTATFTTDDSDHGNGTYVGTVTDTTGAPLADAAVTLVNYIGAYEFSATTDSSGTVTRVLPVGDWLAEIDGSHATGGNSDTTGYAGNYDSFQIRSRHTTTQPPVVLQPGASLTGRATDERGNPLRGVTVYAMAPSPYALQDSGTGSGFAFGFAGELTVPEAVSAADGSYTVRGLPAGAEQVCFDPTLREVTGGTAAQAAAGYLSRCLSDTVDLATGSHSSMPDTQLRSGTGGALTGRVRTPSGKAAPGVFVEVLKGNGAGAVAETDAKGRYYAGGLRPGSYQVCFLPLVITVASRTGFRTTCPTKPVVIRASATTNLKATLRHGGAVTGTVTGPDGDPLEGVGVYTRSGPGESFAVTDSRGHYTIGGLDPRAYRICFDTSTTIPPAGDTGAEPGCLPDKIGATPRRIRTGGDIALAVGGAVTGVLTESDGTPVSGALVDLEAEHPTRNSLGGDATTDADGHYVIGGLPAGRYTACFFVSDDSGNTRTPCDDKVVVVEGQFTNDVSKTLQPLGTVTVTTHDTDADPIAGVDVVVLRDCSSGAECDHLATFGAEQPVRVAASGMTSADGTVSYPLLRPGNYAVCMLAFYASTTVDTPSTGYADACKSTTFDVTVTAGATTAVTKVLRQAGVVTGKVTDSAGHPVRGAVVHVSNSAADDFTPLFPFGLPNDPAQFSKTGADGTYRIRSVAAGGQTVCIDASHAKGGASNAGYLDQCIGGDPGVPTGGTPLVVKSGKATTAPALALTSAAGISGTITATGKLGFAEVSVFDSTGTIVDDDGVGPGGHYKITGLPAAKYRVCVENNHDARCYVNARWTTRKPPAKAKRVRTTAGAVSSGIDVKLHN